MLVEIKTRLVSSSMASLYMSRLTVVREHGFFDSLHLIRFAGLVSFYSIGDDEYVLFCDHSMLTFSRFVCSCCCCG